MNLKRALLSIAISLVPTGLFLGVTRYIWDTSFVGEDPSFAGCLLYASILFLIVCLAVYNTLEERERKRKRKEVTQND